MIVKIKILPNGFGLPVPTFAKPDDAGADVYAALEQRHPDSVLLRIEPAQWHVVPCGFAIAVPAGYEAQIRPRSGLAAKYGITVLNSPGTIDSAYRGEVCAILINHGPNAFTISRGDRIAQMIIAAVAQPKFIVVDELDVTERGAGGFGSTGHRHGGRLPL